MHVGCWILSLSNIDSVNQTFRLRMHITTARELTPNEKNLLLESEKKDSDIKFVPILNTCIEPLYSTEIIEMKRIQFHTGNDWICVKDDELENLFNNEHTIQELYRADILFSENFELKNFPFDIQHLGFDFQMRCDKLDIKNNIYGYEIINESGIYFYQYPQITGWKFVGLEQSIDNNDVNVEKLNYLHNKHPSGMYNHIIFRIKMQREWKYYFYRVIVVLSIITFMTLGCFLFGDHDLNASISDRFSYVSTMLLTAVAYMLVTVGFLPQLSYLTLLDQYVYFSFIFVLFIAIEIGIVAIINDTIGMNENEMIELDYYMLCIDSIIWFIVHIIFGIFGYNAFQQEILKINMIKEMVDFNNEKRIILILILD